MDGNTSIWSSDNYDPVSIKLCVKEKKNLDSNFQIARVF